MRTIPRPLLSISLIFCLAAAACSPGPPPEADTTSGQEIDSEEVVVSPTDMQVEVLWPDQQGDCITSLPVPSLKMCLAEASSPNALVSIPADLLPGVENALLGTLPGGSWSAPMPLSLSGYPGTDSDAVGMIIISNKPLPEDSLPISGAVAAGIILINTNESQDLIVIQNFPAPGSAEGIVIQNKPTGTSGVSLIELSIPGLDPSALVSDQGFIGEILSYDLLEPLEATQQMAEGVVWGGLVAGVDESFINTSPLIEEFVFLPPLDDNSPPPDDNKTAVVWGGIPADAVGIIIVQNMPGPDQSSEGIIIVHGKDVSQVMGIIMEDKPGEDSGAEGIVIQNKPAEFHSPGISLNAMAWVNQDDAGEGNEGIIIINNMPAADSLGASSSNLGFPEGFGIPEGMTPFLGDTGFGPGPFAILSLDLPMFEGTSDQGGCYQVALDQLLPPGSDGFQVDSFFDVFTELTVGVPQTDQSGELTFVNAPIPFPNYTLCTPEGTQPSDTPEVDTTLPTPTPRSTPVPPTPTTRTGLPTKTPTKTSRLPTPKPTVSRQ